MKKTTVMLLFGGRSSEHGISCATAAGILKAIDRTRYDIIPVGITLEGRWVRLEDSPELYQLQSDGSTYTVTEGSSRIVLTPGSGHALEFFLSKVDGSEHLEEIVDMGRIDVVFPVLHGPYGEDGTIQGLLEMTNTNYVGCGVLSSAACMDKHVTKVLLDHAGLPAGKWELITSRQWKTSRQDVLKRIERLGFPVFVKPCRAGSSIGITKVNSAEDLTEAIEIAREHDPRVIVEAMVNGLEIECAVLDGRNGAAPRATRPGCIAMDDSVDFYDYQTKYVKTDSVDLQIPAPISEELVQRVQELALAAFDAVEGEGLARVDFFVDIDNGQIVINEINTMPGFTPYSMYPALWAEEGLAYQDLVTELIELAHSRSRGLR